MAEKFSLGMLIMFFVAVVIGVVLIQVLADRQVALTELSTTTNESIIMTSQSGEVTNVDLEGLTFFGNATNNTNQASVTIGQEVNFSKNGSVTVSSLHFPADGNYNVSYSFQGDLYVDDKESRTLLVLIILFFVLAILAVAVKGMMDQSDDFNFGGGL